MFKVQGSPWSGRLRGCCAAATWEGGLSIPKDAQLNRKKEKDESRRRTEIRHKQDETTVLTLTYWTPETEAAAQGAAPNSDRWRRGQRMGQSICRYVF